MKIRELLADPESWCQGFSARDSSGDPCEPTYEGATQWCFYGAFYRCHKDKGQEVENKFFDWFQNKMYNFQHCLTTVSYWNDNPLRTHDEVIALAKELDRELGL